MVKVCVTLHPTNALPYLLPVLLSAEVARRLLPGSVSFESFTPELRKTFGETLSEHLSPKIIAQPENLVPVEGEKIDYSVEVEGYSLKYQWTKNILLPIKMIIPCPSKATVQMIMMEYTDSKSQMNSGVIKTREFMIGISITTDWEINPRPYPERCHSNRRRRLACWWKYRLS